jgi:hypothetical protein
VFACIYSILIIHLQRIDYQNELEKKRKNEEMAAQRALQEEQLRKQEESIMRQEKLRKGSYLIYSLAYVVVYL